MRATVEDDLVLAEWLLKAGADPNGVVDSSGTPTTRAKSDEMRSLLYSFGGQPAPIWGYVQQGNLEIVAAILRYCDDPFIEKVPEYQSTPYTAIISGAARKIKKGDSTSQYQAMLKIFLKKKYPMPKCLTSCKSYLYQVPEMTRLLLKHGLDPNLPDWVRRTPLHDIASRGFNQDSVTLIEMFLEHGADINAIDERDCSTPLGIACSEGNLEMVRLLLGEGADPKLAGEEWARPMNWALRKENVEIINALKRHE